MADPEYHQRSEDIRNFKEAHNARMAKVYEIPDEMNPHFIYTFVSTQKDKTIEFSKVGEELYIAPPTSQAKQDTIVLHYQSFAEYPWNGYNTGSKDASTSQPCILDPRLQKSSHGSKYEGRKTE